jgi:hypothetical protein
MNEHTMIFVSKPNVMAVVFSPISLHIGRSTVICIDIRLAAYSYYLFLHERRRMEAVIGIVCLGVGTAKPKSKTEPKSEVGEKQWK